MDKAHKKLKVYKEAIDLAKVIYNETNKLPKEEQYCLAQQMRKCAVSIVSNITEGAARQSTKEQLQFYNVARGSISEIDAQTELCKEIEILNSSSVSLLTSHIDTVDSLLNGLIRYKKEQNNYSKRDKRNA